MVNVKIVQTEKFKPFFEGEMAEAPVIGDEIQLGKTLSIIINKRVIQIDPTGINPDVVYCEGNGN